MYITIIIYKTGSLGHELRVVASPENFWLSGGVHTVFWIEVLGIMGMVPFGAPSLQRMISWIRVSITFLTTVLSGPMGHFCSYTFPERLA